MPRCPKCYSSDVEEQGGFIAKAFGVGIGILVGAIFTALIQSASAAVGILQALSTTGVITFDIALPMLMGVGIGAYVAGHSLEHGHKYKCNKCGHEFD